jgi:hypothetical protein
LIFNDKHIKNFVHLSTDFAILTIIFFRVIWWPESGFCRTELVEV